VSGDKEGQRAMVINKPMLVAVSDDNLLHILLQYLSADDLAEFVMCSHGVAAFIIMNDHHLVSRTQPVGTISIRLRAALSFFTLGLCIWPDDTFAAFHGDATTVYSQQQPVASCSTSVIFQELDA